MKQCTSGADIPQMNSGSPALDAYPYRRNGERLTRTTRDETPQRVIAEHRWALAASGFAGHSSVPMP
jgi:hypothetical protein